MVYRKPRHDWKERAKPPEARKGIEPVMHYTRIQCPNCGSFKRRDVMRRGGTTVHRFKCLSCFTVYIGIETPAFGKTEGRSAAADPDDAPGLDD